MGGNGVDRINEEELKRLDRLRHILDQAGARYELYSHADTVMSAEDGVERGIGNLAEMAPTLVLETEQGLVVAIICGETRLSYKKIKKALGLKNVSLARPDVVLRETGAPVGTVSLINPGLTTIVDSRLTEARVVYGGCGLPRLTLRIEPSDLIAVTRARVFDFTEPK
jgi:Cys-tRNA(Pro)/Cys-tRNA(Cys) deacylase